MTASALPCDRLGWRPFSCARPREVSCAAIAALQHRLALRDREIDTLLGVVQALKRTNDDLRAQRAGSSAPAGRARL